MVRESRRLCHSQGDFFNKHVRTHLHSLTQSLTHSLREREGLGGGGGEGACTQRFTGAFRQMGFLKCEGKDERELSLPTVDGR